MKRCKNCNRVLTPGVIGTGNVCWTCTRPEKNDAFYRLVMKAGNRQCDELSVAELEALDREMELRLKEVNANSGVEVDLS